MRFGSPGAVELERGGREPERGCELLANGIGGAGPGELCSSTERGGQRQLDHYDYDELGSKATEYGHCVRLL